MGNENHFTYIHSVTAQAARCLCFLKGEHYDQWKVYQ